MGKKSRRRRGQGQVLARPQSTKKELEEALFGSHDPNQPPIQFVPFPQPGDGFGKGRSYDPDEATPWKHFCANCYAGAVVYDDFDWDTHEEGTIVKAPDMECGKCHMVWYCDHNCQEQHWQCHKKRCKAFTGTREERKTMKRRAREWESKHEKELDKERGRLQYQKDMIRKQFDFLEAQGEGTAGCPRFKDCISSDEEE